MNAVGVTVKFREINQDSKTLSTYPKEDVEGEEDELEAGKSRQVLLTSTASTVPTAVSTAVPHPSPVLHQPEKQQDSTLKKNNKHTYMYSLMVI